MPRQITFSIHNPKSATFAWNEVGNALNFLGLYWDIQFIQVGNGRIQFHGNFASPSPYWAAWTNGFVCKVSPTYNFHAPAPMYARYLTAKVVCHEFGHMCRPGGQHASVPGLMDASASQPTGNLSQNDCINWFDRVYAKTGRTRPWNEPNAMRVRFGVPIPSAEEATFTTYDLLFECQHKASIWQRFFGGKP